MGMRLFSTLLLLLVSAASGCALPIDATEASVVEDDSSEARVFVDGELGYDAAPPSFSFVVPGERSLVVLAALYDDSVAIGDPAWLTAPYMTEDMIVRRDVNIDAVPLPLLLRQGEPFVTHSASGESCIGYLGELSMVRMISQWNLEFGELSMEERAALDERQDAVGPPALERLSDPAFIWEQALNRTYLVAELEDPDGCVSGTFGAHPEAVGEVYVPNDTDLYDEAAQRLFRASPQYAARQAEYDGLRAEDEYFAEGWPAGPWDESIFSTQVFLAANGKELVLARADWPYCEAGPGALSLLYAVGDDGALHLRQADGVTIPQEEIHALIDQGTDVLQVTPQEVYTSYDNRLSLNSIAPLPTGCGC